LSPVAQLGGIVHQFGGKNLVATESLDNDSVVEWHGTPSPHNS
jgi:hypothetical protein